MVGSGPTNRKSLDECRGRGRCAPRGEGVVTAKQRNRIWRKTFGLSIIGWRYSRIEYRPRVAARPQYPGTPSAHPQWVPIAD